MKSILNLVYLLVICLCSLSSADNSILNGTLTLSGLSSGAFMAVQVHVAYSSLVDGVGVLAGGVYYAAQSSAQTALSIMKNANLIPYDTITNIQMPALALAGDIDGLHNLGNTRAYLFSGVLDSVVDPSNMHLLEKFYSTLNVSLITDFDQRTEHTFPTLAYGNSCGYLGSPYISNCQLDTVFNMLSSLYNYPIFPAAAKYEEANLLIIDQRTFVPPVYAMVADAAGINPRGYIYVPSKCRQALDHNFLTNHLFSSEDSDYDSIRKEQWDTSFLKTHLDRTNGFASARDENGFSALGPVSKCRVHVAFHGCEQSLQKIGEEFVRKTGFLEYAESNEIIVVFPQAQPVTLTNPKGCWNWWGYYEPLTYHTKFSAQPMTVMNIATSLIRNVKKYVK